MLSETVFFIYIYLQQSEYIFFVCLFSVGRCNVCAGLILLHISIVIMIITFINKITLMVNCAIDEMVGKLPGNITAMSIAIQKRRG